MGFHICEYCSTKRFDKLPRQKYLPTSSGDCKIETEEMIIWFPDMVLHYVADHNWLPPQFFIDAIMNNALDSIIRGRLQTREICGKRVERVGYLSGEFPQGAVPEGFLEKLDLVQRACSETGSRAQSKGL